jgi:hypothetical protein
MRGKRVYQPRLDCVRPVTPRGVYEMKERVCSAPCCETRRRRVGDFRLASGCAAAALDWLAAARLDRSGVAKRGAGALATSVGERLLQRSDVKKRDAGALGTCRAAARLQRSGVAKRGADALGTFGCPAAARLPRFGATKRGPWRMMTLAPPLRHLRYTLTWTGWGWVGSGANIIR